MKNNAFSKLIQFLENLEKRHFSYTLTHQRANAITVNAAMPGKRWEVDFFEDGRVAIEQFVSNGEMSGEEQLSDLWQESQPALPFSAPTNGSTPQPATPLVLPLISQPNPTEELRMTSLAIARRFIDELWNQRQLPIADEIIDPTCITHQLRSGMEPVDAPRGPEAIKKQINDWLTAFPDIQYQVRQMLADGDRVVSQCVVRGTHLGPWLGIAATGRAITIEMTLIQRIAEGKIVEDWVLADFFGVFQQLGIVPSLGELLKAR